MTVGSVRVDLCSCPSQRVRVHLPCAMDEILKAIDGSVLWLSEANPIAIGNLQREATVAGVEPTRLIFAKPLPAMSDHLARHRSADVFLDTLPYNAHTTASDALWAGLPVLTQIGETLLGRSSS